MRVDAISHHGKVGSDPVLVHVVLALESVSQIQFTGEPKVGDEIVFAVHYFRGSDVKYSWDFGDGNTLESSTYQVKHTFNRLAVLIKSKKFYHLSICDN